MVNPEKFGPGNIKRGALERGTLEREGGDLSQSQVSPEGVIINDPKTQHQQEVRSIISEQIAGGLKTDEIIRQEKAVAATQRILHYLLKKYEAEANGSDKRNLDLFKFFIKGPDKNNLIRLNRALREKASFEIDLADPALVAIGDEVLGRGNFQNYLHDLALAEERAEENKGQ